MPIKKNILFQFNQYNNAKGLCHGSSTPTIQDEVNRGNLMHIYMKKYICGYKTDTSMAYLIVTMDGYPLANIPLRLLRMVCPQTLVWRTTQTCTHGGGWAGKAGGNNSSQQPVGWRTIRQIAYSWTGKWRWGGRGGGFSLGLIIHLQTQSAVSNIEDALVRDWKALASCWYQLEWMVVDGVVERTWRAGCRPSPPGSPALLHSRSRHRRPANARHKPPPSRSESNSFHSRLFCYMIKF